MTRQASSVDEHPAFLLLCWTDPCGDDAEGVGDGVLGEFREHLLQRFDHAYLCEVFAVDLGFEGRQLFGWDHPFRFGWFRSSA
jgi:hypothetical protein